MNHRCNQCRDVERKFMTAAELARHNELRHGGHSYSLGIKQQPKITRPIPAGKSFEEIWAAMKWDADLIEDQIKEMAAKHDRVEALMEAIELAGKLDHNGRAPKEERPAKAKTESTKVTKKTGTRKIVHAKPAGARKKAAKTTKAPVKPEASKVGLPPSQGGIAPPGKPFWSRRSGRWMADTPREERKAAGNKAARHKGNKQAEKPVASDGDMWEPDAVDRGDAPPPAELLDQAEDSVIDRSAPDSQMDLAVPLTYVLEHNKSGADVRWRQDRVSGCNDDTLLQRINYELGTSGEMKGPDWAARWKRDKGITTLTMQMEGVDAIGLVGQALVDKVRMVLGIDVPELAKKAG